jgi:predicted kinase
MLTSLKEYMLSRAIGAFVHRRERLSKADWAALHAYEARLEKQVTVSSPDPAIIGMIGLVGSGKSSVAAALAVELGGVIIEGDAIRVELRKQGASYESARLIGETLATRFVMKSINAILDSDFVDVHKRASLRAVGRNIRYRVAFVRTICDHDVMVGRIFAASYVDTVEDFFGGASSSWDGANKGAVVKERELWRRTPHHYRWVNKGKTGGVWKLRTFAFKLAGCIDTTHSDWREDILGVANTIRYP